MPGVDQLPPTQYLIMEVLGARHRLGTYTWPFPQELRRSLASLEDAGLIIRSNGPAGSTNARLTETGLRAILDFSHRPPNDIDRYRQALKDIADFAGQRADSIPGMDGVAKTAVNALHPTGRPR